MSKRAAAFGFGLVTVGALLYGQNEGVVEMTKPLSIAEIPAAIAAIDVDTRAVNLMIREALKTDSPDGTAQTPDVAGAAPPVVPPAVLASPEITRAAIASFQNDQNPRCPESPSYHYFIISDPVTKQPVPNTNLCLDMSGAVVATTGQVIVETVLNPASDRVVNLTNALNLPENKPECVGIAERMKPYAQFLLEGTGLPPPGQPIDAVIVASHDTRTLCDNLDPGIYPNAINGAP